MSAGRFTVRVKARTQHAGSWGVRTNFASLRRAGSKQVSR